jgi:Family of unknown function (DUF6326)
MNETRQPTTILEDQRIPVRVKLAAAWTSFMFLYIYVDYLALYKPGFVDDILAGIVHEFDIGPTFLGIGLTLIAIPSLMILLSTTLPARVNRTINLVVATLYIPVSMYNAVGESWTYSYFYGLSIGLEVLPPGLHPALRLDLAPHAGTVDARARRTASLADPAGTVDTWPRSEQPAWPRTSATCGPSTRSTSTYPKAAWPGSSARTVPASPPRSACCSD